MSAAQNYLDLPLSELDSDADERTGRLLVGSQLGPPTRAEAVQRSQEQVGRSDEVNYPKNLCKNWIITELDIWKYVNKCFGYPLDPISEKIEGNPYEYSRVRLRNTFGLPNQYACFDCNSQGDRWSYDYKDIGEYIRTGTGTRFSINITKYVPRCFHCQYQHIATEGIGFNPGSTLSCETNHRRIIPFSAIDNYEFKFCRICGTYRRTPRKGYNAREAYPVIQLSAALSIQL